MIEHIEVLPSPSKWFGATHCFTCNHLRKEHVDDGPCVVIVDWTEVMNLLGNPAFLQGCSCQQFTQNSFVCGWCGQRHLKDSYCDS